MIYFFVGDSDGIGGMQNLFLNLSNELHHQGVESKIIANTNSYLASTLNNIGRNSSLIDLKSLDILNKNFDIDNDILIVTGYVSVAGIEILKKLNPRILVWIVYPDSLIYANKIRSLHIAYFTRRLIKYLYLHNSIVFMDKFNFEAYDKLFKMDYNSGENIIPIPICIKENYFLKRNLIENNKINITYLGRAGVWKFYPLLRLVKDLVRIKKYNSNFNLIIVSDDIDFYKQRLLSYSDKLDITYQQGLNGDQLDNYLINNSDIHFAMGTSCLEGAKLGIPSVMIDFGYNEFPENYQYRWLFNTKDYILGKDITGLKFEGQNNLKDIIGEYNENKYLISSQTHKYVQEYHSLSMIARNFLFKTENAKCRLLDFYSLCLTDSTVIRFINKL